MVKVAKKLFTMSVVTLTILWSVGIAALVPTTVNAVDCPELEAGDLFKVPGNTAVYLLNADMERMYFPNAEVYKTWYADYSGVVEIPTTCVDAYPAPSVAPYGVNYRPGSRLVKVQISDSVYAVSPNNTKVKIGSEAVAKALYGDNWAKLVRDVADVYWPNLVNTGSEMTTAALHDGMIVKSGTTVYSVDGGKLYEVDGDLGVAAGDVRTVAASLISAKEMASTDVTAASLVENPAQTSATEGSGDTPATTGDLSLSLAASTPDSMKIPKDIQGITYLTLNAKAGNEDVDITSLTIKRKGLGDSDDFSKVYIEVDGIRHGSKRVLGSDSEVAIYFATESSKITVPANSSVKIDVVADMDSSVSGNDNYLQVTAVETTAKLDADLPISGNEMTTSNVTAPEMTFTYNEDGTSLTVGDTDSTVGGFTLDGDTNEDVVLNTVTLKQVGSADKAEVTNYSLYYDDELIAGPVSLDGDYVKFVLDDPMTIAQDESYDFTVKADIEGGNGETVTLELDETTDVYAVGTDNDFRSNVLNSDTAEEFSITGGALSIDEHKDNPNTETYAPKTDDVLMLVAELKAEDETVVVTELPLSFTGTFYTSTTTLDNVTVKLDGKVVCGPVEVGGTDGDSTETLTCEDEFEVHGTQKLTVTADVTEDATGDYTVSILSAGNGIKIENLDGDALYSTGTTYDVSGSAVGKDVTVDSGTLTVSKDTKYTDRSITTGASEYKVASFVVKSPASQDVKIKKYTVTIADGTGTRYGVENLSDLRVSEDTDVISNPDGTDEFNVSQLLAKETTKTVSVYASFDNNTTGTITASLNVEYRGESDEITTSTGAKVGQTITVQTGSVTTTVASTNPDADIVLSDAANTKVFVVEFNADYDTYTITDMDILMSDSAAVTSLKIGDKTVTEFVDDVASFSGLNIAVTDKTKVELYATFNTVGDDGVDSGVTTTFKLAGYEASAAQGTDINYADADILDTVISETFELRAARPVLSYSTVDTLLVAGDNDVVKMTVTPDTGTVNLLGITATVGGDVSTTDDYVTLVYNNTELATTTITDLGDASGWDLTAESNYADFQSDLEVGAAKSFVIRVNAAAVAGGEDIYVKVTDIAWDDDETDSTIDGTYVSLLPSKQYTVSKAS